VTSDEDKAQSPQSRLTAADRAGIDRWRKKCAKLPPMSEEQIASVARIYRRIDARRARRQAEDQNEHS
jgi:hypothetical protein